MSRATRRITPAVLAVVAMVFVGSALMAGAGAHARQASHTAAKAQAGSPMIFDPANSWALLVGISTYNHPTHPTYGGDGDVSVFHELLNEAGWPDSHILILTDQQATADAIRSSIHWLVTKSNDTTFSVFHYSGHVQLQSGHTWLWGSDNQFISENEFGQDMGGLQGHAWIDVSGCESAAFDQGLSSSQRFFTASSMSNQKSYEEPSWGESVWTGFDIDQAMLQHKAGSGPVSIQAAVRWSQPNAQQYTSQQSYGPQEPYAVGGDGEWYLGPAAATGQSSDTAPTTSQPSGGGGNPPPPPQGPCTRVGGITYKCQH